MHQFSDSTNSICLKSLEKPRDLYMYKYVYDHTPGTLGQFDPSDLSPLFTVSLTCETDFIYDTPTLENANGSARTGSGCTASSLISSPTSPLSCTSSHLPHSATTLFQRSLSSHSLHKNELHPPFSTTPTILDFGPVRRVSSTADLDQGVNMLCRPCHHEGSPLANETTSIIEGMTKPCRYSPEEKKERIERYRIKRSQRNFNKKIQYSCRKTLADSRARVRGRFARNEELKKADYSPDIQWIQLAEEEEDWMHLMDSISYSIVP